MRFYAVCRRCSKLLKHQEFKTIGLYVEPSDACDGCGNNIGSTPDNRGTDYFAVSDDQLYEILSQLQ
jgi:rRNA maturation endonuclease Nob1